MNEQFSKKELDKLFKEPRHDWKVYYLEQAEVVKRKSKDKSTQVGCVIVDENDEPVSQGFNGMPKGVDESKLHWDERELKYLEVVHAEMNALIYAKRSLKGCTVYTTNAPCENCLKHLLAAGCRSIFYDSADPIRVRGTKLQKEAIDALISASGATVKNINGDHYYIELLESEGLKDVRV